MERSSRLLITGAVDRCVKIRRLSGRKPKTKFIGDALAPRPIWLATWRVGKIEGRGAEGRREEKREEGVRVAREGGRTKKESHRKGWPRGD